MNEFSPKYIVQIYESEKIMLNVHCMYFSVYRWTVRHADNSYRSPSKLNNISGAVIYGETFRYHAISLLTLILPDTRAKRWQKKLPLRIFSYNPTLSAVRWRNLSLSSFISVDRECFDYHKSKRIMMNASIASVFTVKYKIKETV